MILQDAAGRQKQRLAATRHGLKQWSVIPGFGLTLGYTVIYLGFLVVIPLGMLIVKTSAMGWPRFWAVVTEPRVMAAYRLSFGAAMLAACLNAAAGSLVAWVLVRYRFPGRRLVDGLVDLPFALPTAVAGICLTTLYAPNGWLGGPLLAMGMRVAYTQLGILLALMFVGLPFVVRTVQPALQDLNHELEEAAASLGASRFQTVRRVIWPAVLPAVITGFALAFARGVGEYGSVVFIAGNMPMKTEIAPLLIMSRLEEYNYAGAPAIAVVMLSVSFLLLLAVSGLQWWNARRYGIA